jgi:ATP-binding cassette subfamily B protein
VPLVVIIGDFVQPYIQSQVLQKITDGQFDKANIWGSFGPQIVAYLIAVVASGIIGWRVIVWLYWRLDANVLRDMSQSIFDHLMSMSPNFHANRFGGSLVSQANKLTGAYERFVDATIFNLYTLLISIAATVIVLLPRAPLYTAVLVSLSIIYLVGTIYFSKAVLDDNREEAESQSRQTGFLADSMTNVMAIKSFSAADYEKQRYWQAASTTRAKSLKSMRATMIRETYSSVVTSAIGISALFIAILGVAIFHSNLATLFLIVSYTSAIGMRLWEFQNVLRQYNRALGDASDMVKILQIEPEIKDPPRPAQVHIRRGEITFKDMSFTHADDQQALFQNLNLHSGSGKTTLTKLLLRFSDIDSGTILIDGQDINSITQDDLRQHIAYVPQEPLLFHRTLAENIAYGRPEASQQEIEAVAKMAHAHDFVGQLPKGYDTLVGERGVKLSGGQRQRVAIARAMIKNAPILVLDEATSALDSESEALIQDALWQLMEGRTAIVIAHRLSTIQRMDRIIVLDEGQVVEEGTHRELIRRDGVYANLWNRQSGGFLDE